MVDGLFAAGVRLRKRTGYSVGLKPLVGGRGIGVVGGVGAKLGLFLVCALGDPGVTPENSGGRCLVLGVRALGRVSVGADTRGDRLRF